VVLPSNESGFQVQSRLAPYGWRAFLIEFLCGLLYVMWFMLMLAESTALKGIKRLENLAVPQSGERSN
jgi:hypothetical protein